MGALAVLIAIFLLAPGLGEVRHRLGDASPGWLVVATLLEGLSCVSYVVMFGPIFCTGLTWQRSWQIGGSELAMGSLVPASGAGGLALGAPPRLGPGADPGPEASRTRRALSSTRRALIDGTAEALKILRSGNLRVLAGSVGYWLFDNAVLWATYHAFGLSPPVTIILMGYLIGQLGGALPIPGGIGGIDLGLIGAMIAYGAPAAGTAAAVLAYRVILFWLPLIAGGVAFIQLRRDMPSGGELAACAPAIAAQSALPPR